MTELQNYIKTHFEIIQADELDEVCALFSSKLVKKGTFFLKENEICDQFCFIKSGYLRIYANSDDKEITQWIATSGYFGTDFSSFFFQKPSRWNIHALEDTELFLITKENYNKIGSIIPNWNELEKSFLIKCLTLVESRVYSHLSMTAEERYTHFFENNKALFNQIPLQYIASMLGMTPETFSRIRKNKVS